MADVDILNALLTAEYQAIKAYSAGAGILQSPPSNDPLRDAAPTVLAVAVHFQSQHRDHANELVRLVQAASGTPVAESAVTFAPPSDFSASVANVIKLAANAEKAAAVAYSDVLKSVEDQTRAELIAAIGGVETQHFIVLSLLARGIIQATASTQAMATDVVPKSFVANVGPTGSGFSSIPDFTYGT